MPRQPTYPRKMRRKIHISVLGAGRVGKSALTARYIFDIWVSQYDPTIQHNYLVNQSIDGHCVQMDILDAAGYDDFWGFEDSHIRHGDGFLLVFDEAAPPSVVNVEQFKARINLLKGYQVPIVLVGNKGDLPWLDASERKDKGARLSRKWGAPCFYASAKTGENVAEAFTELSRLILRAKGAILDPVLEDEDEDGTATGRAKSAIAAAVVSSTGSALAPSVAPMLVSGWDYSDDEADDEGSSWTSVESGWGRAGWARRGRKGGVRQTICGLLRAVVRIRVRRVRDQSGGSLTGRVRFVPPMFGGPE